MTPFCFRIVEAHLGQPADLPEAPLIVALFWGFLPALIAFIIGCVRHGLKFAVRRGWWLLLLLGWIFVSWRIMLLLPSGLQDPLGVAFVIYGGMAVCWIVAGFLVLRPLNGNERDRGGAP